MEYDFRKNAPYPSYKASPPVYGQSMYPRVANQHGHAAPMAHPSPSHHHTAPPPPPPPPLSPGLGIRVMIKPEYRIMPPPQLHPQVGDIRRSNFQFDFDFERKLLAEAEKESQNWNRIMMDNLPSKISESSPPPSPRPPGDPIISKYIAAGLCREAVPFAVSAHGDSPTKVREFVNGYTLLREMGFSSSSITEALITYENDTDKVLAHFLNGSS